MTLQTLIEKAPNYSNRNDVAKLIDIYEEIENLHPALFRELVELEDTLIAEAMQVVIDKACEMQRKNCSETDFYHYDGCEKSLYLAKTNILDATRPKMEELWN